VSAGEAPPAGRHPADDLDLASSAEREQVVGAFLPPYNRATVTTVPTRTAGSARSDDPIWADRVSLPLLTASRMQRMLSGDVASVEGEIGATLPAWWIEEREWLLRLRLKQVQDHPAAEPWLIRPIVPHAAEPVAAGLINFHGPPDERGFVEVGYELQPEFRGQGYAIAAVRAYFDWAAATHGIRRFRAGIVPGNERSINLVTKLGMTKAGAQWDADDGLELLYTVEGWEPA
jgi:RimJ/RimL family protein N-acetyltransferase